MHLETHTKNELNIYLASKTKIMLNEKKKISKEKKTFKFEEEGGKTRDSVLFWIKTHLNLLNVIEFKQNKKCIPQNSSNNKIYLLKQRRRKTQNHKKTC